MAEDVRLVLRCDVLAEERLSAESFLALVLEVVAPSEPLVSIAVLETLPALGTDEPDELDLSGFL